MITISPPPFVEKIKYKHCRQINDPITRKRVYQTPDGECLPSVTTILSSTKDMTHLNEWKKRIGEEKANFFFMLFRKAFPIEMVLFATHSK